MADSEKLQRASSIGLWTVTILMLVLLTIQGWSGNWVTFFLALPGGPNLTPTFLAAMANLSVYHARVGFAIGAISILVIIFAFINKRNILVRIFAILGLLINISAAMGGFLFVTSGYQDRWGLGQMADSFVGAYAAYFLQLFFMCGKWTNLFKRKPQNIANV